MRMLATGQNCLPEGGIGAVADQLAAKLGPESLLLGAWVGGGCCCCCCCCCWGAGVVGGLVLLGG